MTPDERLAVHLRSWVGTWPPPSSDVHVVGDPARRRPTWDGTVRPLLGMSDGTGTVISVPPDTSTEVAAAFADGLETPDLGDHLGEILGVGPARFGSGVFRTTSTVDPSIDDVGEWFDHQSDGLPAWLAPFNGPRLVAFDDGGTRTPVASVGIKIHDRYGYELAVVTEPASQGRGLARRLVATAARWVLEQGAVPTYLHDPANTASAHVAEAVGFEDRGWRVHGLWAGR